MIKFEARNVSNFSSYHFTFKRGKFFNKNLKSPLHVIPIEPPKTFQMLVGIRNMYILLNTKILHCPSFKNASTVFVEDFFKG